MTMKMLALHAKFIFAFSKCTKHMQVHCTRDWMSETLKNLREHNIWNCSIINSIKLYSWCAFCQSSLLNWVLNWRKEQKCSLWVSCWCFLILFRDINLAFFLYNISYNLQCFCHFPSLSWGAVYSSSVVCSLFWV